MQITMGSWLVWALMSAMFAALTAIFGKIGVAGINSDFAMLIRTLVILVVITAIVMATGAYQPPSTVSARTYVFLIWVFRESSG